MRTLLVMGASLAVGLTLAVVSYGAPVRTRVNLPLRALARPARASDTLPYKPGGLVGQVLLSRRVATYTDQHRRTTNFFVYEVRGRLRHVKSAYGVWFCSLLVKQGAGGGGGCGPIQEVANVFANQPVAVWHGNNTYDGEYVWGIAANDVQSVVLIESNGVRHNMALSADHGFIYNCGACAGSIDAYGQRGELLSAQRLPPLT